MNLDISLRQRPFPGLTEAAIRRLQTGIWLSTLMLAIALNVVTLPQFLDGTLEVSGFNLTPAEREDFRGHLAELGISAHTFAIIGLAGTTLQDALVIGLSLVLLRKRNVVDWFAWYVSIVMVADTAAMYPPAVHDLVDGSRFWVVVGKAVTALAVTSLFLIPLLFPTGRFAPRWMVAPAAFISAGVLSFVISPGTDGGGDLAHPAEALANVAMLALVAGSIVYRYRRRATPIQQ